MPRSSPLPARDRGLAYGLGAYGLWGLLPLYFPLLVPAGALEIIAHRVVWSLLFCLLLVLALRSWGSLRTVLRSPRRVGLLALAGVLVAVNWTVYVYGVLTDRVVDASLGYFINPIVTVVLAVLFLRERLRVVQWVALGFGASAIVVMTVGYGQLPWIGLTLATSFGLYGFIKNRVGRDVSAIDGLTVETAALTPLALGYVLWLGSVGELTFGHHGTGHVLLLMAAGAITAVPLLLFGAAARRLPLSTVGLLQYGTPVMQFLIGVLVFGERMPPARWAGFALVWVALVLLTVDGLRAARATSRLARATDPVTRPDSPEGRLDPGSPPTTRRPDADPGADRPPG